MNVYLSGGSAGNSLETTAVQLTADALGVDIADVQTLQGDAAIAPQGGGTNGSRSGSMAAGAIAQTAGILRERIVAIAASRLGVAVEDVGPMINPDVVEGQIYGGTVQGIGGALYEHLAYDEDGNPVATTFLDYLLPTARARYP